MAIVRPKFFFPITVTASNKGIRVNDGVTDSTVNIAEGTYYSAEALRAAVETAITGALAAAKVYLSIYTKSGTYAVDRSGRFIFEWGGATFTIKWSHVASTAYEILGATAVDVTCTTQSVTCQRNGSTSTVNSKLVMTPYQHKNGFYPETPPAIDSLSIRDKGMNVTTRSVAGQQKTITEVELSERRWVFRWLEVHKTYKNLESTRLYESLERLWESGYDRFRHFPDETSESSYTDFVLSQETARRWEPTRQFTKRALYEVELLAWTYVA